jgi:hypothetical protein
MWNGEVICFHETKLEHIRRAEVRSLWGNRFTDLVFLESERALGEILIMWDKRVADFKIVLKASTPYPANS